MRIRATVHEPTHGHAHVHNAPEQSENEPARKRYTVGGSYLGTFLFHNGTLY